MTSIRTVTFWPSMTQRSDDQHQDSNILTISDCSMDEERGETDTGGRDVYPILSWAWVLSPQVNLLLVHTCQVHWWPVYMQLAYHQHFTSSCNSSVPTLSDFWCTTGHAQDPLETTAPGPPASSHMHTHYRMQSWSTTYQTCVPIHFVWDHSGLKNFMWNP